MERFDLYTFIHKGIRRILFDTARLIAATDFEDQREGAAAAEAFGSLLAFLDEHAAHEDEVIMPELAALAPELFIDLRAEHARVDGLQRELAGIFARLEGATACERISLGRRIEDRMGKLVATLLLHLAREESDANRLLWAHRDDERLRALQVRITSSVDPARLAQWYALALPAANARERRNLLRSLREKLSSERFALISAPARAELGEEAWNEALEPVLG